MTITSLNAETPQEGKGTGRRIVSYNPMVPEELRVRSGLPNFFAKLAAGKPVSIAYLGGSNTDAIYRDDFGRTHAMLRGAIKTEKIGETLTVKWTGTTIGFSDIPYGSGIEVEVSVDVAPAILFKRTQNEKKKYSRFLYLPEQKSGPHTAILTVKALPEGGAFYSGQVLIVGKRTGD